MLAQRREREKRGRWGEEEEAQSMYGLLLCVMMANSMPCEAQSAPAYKQPLCCTWRRRVPGAVAHPWGATVGEGRRSPRINGRGVDTLPTRPGRCVADAEASGEKAVA